MKHVIIGGCKTNVVVACWQGPSELEQRSKSQEDHLFRPDGLGCMKPSDELSLSFANTFKGGVTNDLKLLQIHIAWVWGRLPSLDEL